MAPADAPRPLCGRVVDLRLVPVAGVTVSSSGGSSRDEARSTTTGADGRFELPVQREILALLARHPDGRCTLVAVKGRPGAQVGDVVLRDAATVHFALVLPPGLTADQIKRAHFSFGTQGHELDLTDATWPDGALEATFPGVPAGKWHVYLRVADHYGVARFMLVAGEQLNVELELRPAVPVERGSIRLVVQDGAGRAISTAQVIQRSTDRLVGRTDGLGRVTIPAADRLRMLGVWAPDYVGQELRLPSVGDDDVTISLAPAGAIRCRLDAALRTAGHIDRWQDNIIVLPEHHTANDLPCRCDYRIESGELEIRGVPCGRCTLIISPRTAPPVKCTVVVEHGKTSDAGTLSLPDGRTLAVRVVDESGNPVAKARVTILCQPTSLMLSATTGSNGEVSFSALPRDAQLVAAARLDAGDLYSDEIEVAADQTAVRLTLGAPGSVNGVVQSADGQPLAGLSLNVTRGSGTRGLDYADVINTDANGRFFIECVPPGTCRITPNEIIGADRNAWPTCRVVAGETIDVIVTAPESQVVAGRVVDSEGKPPTRRVVVRIAGSSNRSPGVMTDEQGRFVLCANRRRSLEVSADSWPTMVFDVGSGQLVLQLPWDHRGPARVEFSLVNASGGDPPDALVALELKPDFRTMRDGPRADFGALYFHSGRLRDPVPVPPGKWRIVQRRSTAGREWTMPGGDVVFEVACGQQLAVKVGLVAAAQLHVMLDGALPGATYTMTANAGELPLLSGSSGSGAEADPLRLAGFTVGHTWTVSIHEHIGTRSRRAATLEWLPDTPGPAKLRVTIEPE